VTDSILCDRCVEVTMQRVGSKEGSGSGGGSGGAGNDRQWQ
jgi:hypothetical protein